MLFYNSKLKPYSRELRKNMTDAEIHLWLKLRRKQLNSCQFYRQRIIGQYIVDFYCPGAKLIIELDGSQHYTGEMVERDSKRDEYLKNRGLKVLRFTDTDVLKNIDGVLEAILENIKVPEENPP